MKRKKASDIVTYFWSRDNRRLIDTITRALLVGRVIKAFDSIDIEDDVGINVGAFYFVSGPKWLVRWLSKASDWVGVDKDKVRANNRVKIITDDKGIRGFWHLDRA